MIYADRNGNRTEKTTRQDRFLEYIYGHTLTRMMLKPLLGSRILPTWTEKCWTAECPGC